MKKKLLLAILLLFNFLTQAQTDKTLPDSSTLTQIVYLIGNAGQKGNNKVFKVLQMQLSENQEISTVLFLGDNVLPKGLPNKWEINYHDAEKLLLKQLELVEDFSGKTYFIPGNADWGNGKARGKQRLHNQEKLIEKKLKNDSSFLPRKGCQGPEEVVLSKDVVLIVIDTQWLIQNYNSETFAENACNNCVRESDFVSQLSYALRRNEGKKIILAAHHPLFSSGEYNGYYPLITNIFPFTLISHSLLIPAPGFLYTGYHRFLGSPQDISSPQFRLLRKQLMPIFRTSPNLIYTSAHEQHLELLHTDSIHFIISGSASKSSFAKQTEFSDFVSKEKGFSRLLFYQNGDVWVEFYGVTKHHKNQSDTTMVEGKLLNRSFLFSQEIKHDSLLTTYRTYTYTDSSISVAPSQLYSTGKMKQFWLGKNYRKEWETPVRVPYFDIMNEKKGLYIYQRAGGMASISFRMRDSLGHEYALRSVDKVAAKNLPKEFLNTFAVDVIQDQISGSHPFAAAIVPTLAQAAGVFHSNPKIVYVPNDIMLKHYRQDLANQLFLFEERPDENWETLPSFGNSKEIISTNDAIELLQKSHKYRINKESFLRARIFDLLINDWDRHEDQWRIATMEHPDYVDFQPIPRDRDQAFFLVSGVLPKIVSKFRILRKLQSFDNDTKYVPGLLYNARYFDRTFLTQSSLNDWLSTAKQMQTNINDSVISSAFHSLPPELYAISGQIMIDKLKSRREKLPKFAEDAYRFLAKKVDVVGTDERENFMVERKNDTETEVTVYKISAKKEKKDKILYHRVFNINETKEIRLYGLGDKDKFTVSGNVNKGILVRIIGGDGRDEITDESHVKGLRRKTKVYDIKNLNPQMAYAHGPDYKPNTNLSLGSEAKNCTSFDYAVNDYNRTEFQYNRVIPTLFFGYNRDDGIFTGGGAIWTTQGFRKPRYATRQTLVGNRAYETHAFNFKYTADFRYVLYNWDLTFQAEINAPNYTRNFFGFGNQNKVHTMEIDSFRVRFNQLYINPMLKHEWNNNNILSVGIFYQKTRIAREHKGHFSQNPLYQLDTTVFKAHEYLGLKSSFTFDSRDDAVLPTKGFIWKTDADWYYGTNRFSGNFTQMTSECSFYFSFWHPATTVLAFRFGGAINSGDYQFFQANSLGAHDNLRGYYKYRFSGDSYLFQNTEIRFLLLNFKNYLFNGKLGIYAFYDVGRIYMLTGSNSKKWHNGYGGGFWLAPFEKAVFTSSYAQSSEIWMLEVKFGFMF